MGEHSCFGSGEPHEEQDLVYLAHFPADTSIDTLIALVTLHLSS